MQSCEVLGEFYDKFQKTISLVQELFLDMREHEMYNSFAAKGGRSGYSFTLNAHADGVGFFIRGCEFWAEYSMFYDEEAYEWKEFQERRYSDDYVRSAIAFGRSKRTNGFLIADSEKDVWMQNPIQEEQYFQQMTRFDLASEDLYNKFLCLNLPFSVLFELDTNDNGIETLAELMNNPTIIEQIQQDFNLFVATERATHKIRKRNV